MASRTMNKVHQPDPNRIRRPSFVRAFEVEFELARRRIEVDREDVDMISEEGEEERRHFSI